ncbi:MAG: hypothetical protein H0T45_00710 [Pyrinomonadaceae bacterium]|nr:hypothetical protein [Pyrinomonadaceae bacterium]
MSDDILTRRHWRRQLVAARSLRAVIGVPATLHCVGPRRLFFGSDASRGCSRGRGCGVLVRQAGWGFGFEPLLKPTAIFVAPLCLAFARLALCCCQVNGHRLTRFRHGLLILLSQAERSLADEVIERRRFITAWLPFVALSVRTDLRLLIGVIVFERF